MRKLYMPFSFNKVFLWQQQSYQIFKMLLHCVFLFPKWNVLLLLKFFVLIVCVRVGGKAANTSVKEDVFTYVKYKNAYRSTSLML